MTTSTPTVSGPNAVHAIEKDIFELRTDALNLLILMGFSTLIPLTVMALIAAEYRLLLPFGTVAALMLLSSRLRSTKFQLASQIFVLALMLGPILDVAMRGPNIASYLFLSLAVLAANLLQDIEAIPQIVTAAVVAMLLQTATFQGFIPALSTVFAPSVVCILTGAVAYLNEQNILQMVQWALDLQRKDTQRADMFYKQGEELKRTVLELQHTRSKLESLNEELKVAKEKTEQVSRAKSVFLSNMSHELRTPLNVIIGYSSSMLDMPQMYNNTTLPEIFRDDTQLIRDNGRYLVGLISDILDLSKIEAGRLELNRSAINLNEIFRGVIATSIGLVKDKPVQIRPDYPDKLPDVWADPMRVRQILLNLLSNAVKFTEIGSVTLHAYIENNNIHVAVTDTGIGIPEYALAHIFDRFQQAEHDTQQRYGGTGLGLDISKQLAMMHGSDLIVTSNVGEGSTFSFALPMVGGQDLAAIVTQDVPSVIEEEDKTLPLVSYTSSVILLVEHETSIRNMMRRALESAGYLVVATEDMDHVITTAVSVLPDVIIFDTRTPNGDGWKMMEKLKQSEDTRATPIIISTVGNDRDHALQAGAAAFLHKPVTPEELLKTLRHVIVPQTNMDN